MESPIRWRTQRSHMRFRPPSRRRWVRRIVWVFVGLALAFWLSLASRDPALYPPRGEVLAIHVIDHGYHSGVIIPIAHLNRAAAAMDRDDPAGAERLRWLAGLYSGADWLEIGWGDAEFYRATPTIDDVDLWSGVRALVIPTAAVLQVVPGDIAPEQIFEASERKQIGLSPEGLLGLARRLASTIPEPVPGRALGPSLYGAGGFFPARLDYHLFRTCNHWIAWLLRGAGVPASSVPGTFSTTLMLELRLRIPGVN